ncbi:MAG: hypothetical protein WC887_02715 [Candidatus Paceibacterota bacterium]|jgi:hypothetical protein
MNIIKKYIVYLRDNPQGYWFKRKLYGWGWVPVRWQGWAVVAFFMLLVISDGVTMAESAKGGDPTETQLLWFFAQIIIAVAALIIICYWKGEKPRWQWGIPKEDNTDTKSL